MKHLPRNTRKCLAAADKAAGDATFEMQDFNYHFAKVKYYTKRQEKIQQLAGATVELLWMVNHNLSVLKHLAK